MLLHKSCIPRCVDEFGLLNHLLSITEAQYSARKSYRKQDSKSGFATTNEGPKELGFSPIYLPRKLDLSTLLFQKNTFTIDNFESMKNLKNAAQIRITKKLEFPSLFSIIS